VQLKAGSREIMSRDELRSSLLRLLESGRVVAEDMLDFTMVINHRIDVSVLGRICERMASSIPSAVDVVLTAAASGIGFSTLIGNCIGKPVVFAQKGSNPPIIMVGKKMVSREITSATKGGRINLYLCADAMVGCERVLLADDFLFRGTTMKALIEMVRELGLTPVEVLVFVNKRFDVGWKLIEEECDVNVRPVISIKSVAVDAEGYATLHIDEIMDEHCDLTLRIPRYPLQCE